MTKVKCLARQAGKFIRFPLRNKNKPNATDIYCYTVMQHLNSKQTPVGIGNGHLANACFEANFRNQDRTGIRRKAQRAAKAALSCLSLPQGGDASQQPVHAVYKVKGAFPDLSPVSELASKCH